MPIRQDGASTPIVGILLAAAVFIAALATGVSITANEARTTGSEDRELRSVARDALALVVTDPGRTEGGGQSWHTDPDGKTAAANRLVKFGLASERGRNFLSGEKMDALRLGAKTADATNDHPDYPEVRTALGLDGYDFHLRSFPIVYSVEDDRWTKFRGVRVAYIGEFQSASATPPAVTVQVASSVQASYALTKFKIVCSTAGQSVQPDVLLLTTRLRTGNGGGYGTVIQNHYSPVIDCSRSPADWATVTVRHELLDWKSASYPELTYDLKSTYTNALLVNNGASSALTGIAEANEPYTLLAEPERHNFYDAPSPAAAPHLLLDKLAKSGERYVPGASDPDVVVDVTVSWVDDGGTPRTASYAGVTVPDDASLRLPLTGLTPTTAYKTFNVTVASTDGASAQESHFTYTANRVAQASLESTERSKSERFLVSRMIEDFRNTTYADAGGDVFRDVVQDTRQTLADTPHGNRILWKGRDGVAGNDDDYDVLVIGGGVKSSALAGEMAASARKWVEEGNTLIVLGVDENNAQWLNAEFDIKVVTASGGLSAPDETHASLTSPDQLNWRSYDAEGRRYEMTGTTYEGFTHVIVDASGGTTKDLLAISNPGVYAKGTVILSSFIPHTMGGGGRENEKFLNNVFTQSLRQMIIDFGPAIPAGASVGSANRLTVVPHPEDPTLFVELKLVLYVWK